MAEPRVDATGVEGPSAVAGMRRLVTAEAVELEIPTASVGLRMLALVIDLVVVAASMALVGWIAFQLVSLVPDTEAVVVVAFTVVLAMPLVTTWLMEGITNGQSLGKAITGLQVVTVEGGPIGWKHAGIRAAFASFEIWLTLGFVAMVTAMVSSRGQRLGDMAAGTLVVRRARRGVVVTPVRFTAPPAARHIAATLDVSGLDHGDYQVVRSALLRRGLAPAVHAQLCAEVVRSVWPRITAAPLPTDLPAPDVLTAIAAAFQDQHAGPGDGMRPREWVWPGMHG